MRSQTLIRCSILLALIAGPRCASGSTIDFSSLSGTGTLVSGPFGDFLQQGGSVVVDGFTFTSSFAAGTFGLAIWTASDPSHPAGGAAATGLFEYNAAQTTTISKNGGGAFELSGIDLTEWGANMPGGPGTFDVTFIGTKSNLIDTVSQTFHVARNAGSPVFQSFLFSGFSDVNNVKVVQGTFNGGDAFQFNNLVIAGDDAPVGVPEPASLLLMSSGTLSLLAWRRRLARKA
jgi:PEP-CTERM motif